MLAALIFDIPHTCNSVGSAPARFTLVMTKSGSCHATIGVVTPFVDNINHASFLVLCAKNGFFPNKSAIRLSFAFHNRTCNVKNIFHFRGTMSFAEQWLAPINTKSGLAATALMAANS